MPRKPAYDRDALIAQARDIFWRHGWAGTSLKDLERELKLKPGNVYVARSRIMARLSKLVQSRMNETQQ